VIEIYNSNGVLVKALKQRIEAGEQRIAVNTGNLVPGVYLVKTVSNVKIETKKLVVE
jgi:hypothetical protein